MGFKVITPPPDEPITTAEAMAHLRLDEDDATMLPIYLSAAREHAERFTGRTIARQTIEVAFDAFPAAEIELPHSPVMSIQSVDYTGADGADATLDPGAYVLDDYSEPQWLLPVIGSAWPATQSVINAVRVRYVAGYGEGKPLPAPIRAAILLTLGHLYANRESVTVKAPATELPLGVIALLRDYRRRMGL